MKNGTILLVTLWMLAILSILAIGIGIRTSVDLKLVSYQVDSLKAYEVAKAGIMKVISELERDEKKETDTIWECGISLKEDETFKEKFNNVRVGEGYFDVSSIEDMQGKININRATKGILMGLLAPAANAGELADNIRAWRGDSGTDAPPETAKVYTDKEYQCKGAPFDTIGELLLVKDMTREIYDGSDEITGLKGSVAIYGPKEFKININTAGQKTLEAVLAACGLDKTAAERIASHRMGEDGNIDAIGDNNPFTDADNVKGFLTSADGGVPDTAKIAYFNNFIMFNSDYFKVRSTGTLEGKKSSIHKSITCVVERTLSGAPPHKTEIVSWIEE